jgi:hypothetical protein
LLTLLREHRAHRGDRSLEPPEHRARRPCRFNTIRRGGGRPALRCQAPAPDRTLLSEDACRWRARAP